MKSLTEDLKTPKASLPEFSAICERVLEYLPAVVSSSIQVRDSFIIFVSENANQKKYVRPINSQLFISRVSDYRDLYPKAIETLGLVKKGQRKFSIEELTILDRVFYTIQQSIGIGLDLLLEDNSARKHVGNRFEEFLKTIITSIGIQNKNITFQIPYDTDEGEKIYRCETDLVISPYENVRSTVNNVAANEVVLSFKTTSKDRMGKIFLDKLLMERFSGHPVKVAGIFLNDVQRKGNDNISYTLVSGLFMVYTRFLTQLDGVYFFDLPPVAKKSPYNDHIFPFSKFLTTDVWKLLS